MPFLGQHPGIALEKATMKGRQEGGISSLVSLTSHIHEKHGIKCVLDKEKVRVFTYPHLL